MGRTPRPPPSPEAARWLRLSRIDVHGIGEETGHLEAFARLFALYAFQKSRSREVQRLSTLLDRLLDDLDEGIERVIEANVEEIQEQEAQAKEAA
jgi:uncharacterized protein YjiS (DUF1127 family)